MYYSFQLASGELLEQSEDFSAQLVLDGDVNRDGFQDIIVATNAEEESE